MLLNLRMDIKINKFDIRSIYAVFSFSDYDEKRDNQKYFVSKKTCYPENCLFVFVFWGLTSEQQTGSMDQLHSIFVVNTEILRSSIIIADTRGVPMCKVVSPTMRI